MLQTRIGESDFFGAGCFLSLLFHKTQDLKRGRKINLTEGWFALVYLLLVRNAFGQFWSNSFFLFFSVTMMWRYRKSIFNVKVKTSGVLVFLSFLLGRFSKANALNNSTRQTRF